MWSAPRMAETRWEMMKHRHVPGALPDGLPEPGVGGEVQGRGAVVQDQDVRLAHQGPGDGQALLLAPGEVASALLDLQVQPLALAVHKLPGLGDVQGPVDLLVRGVGLAPPHVFPQGAGEDRGLLGDDADPPADGGGAEALHIPAEEADGPPGAVVEAGDEVCQGGLPGARAADDADGLPGHGGEGDAVEGLLPGAGVGEVHVLKGDGGQRRCRQRRGRPLRSPGWRGLCRRWR